MFVTHSEIAMNKLIHLLCFLFAFVFGKIARGQEAIPPIELEARPVWSINDGNVPFSLVTEGTSNNITADCTVEFGDGSKPLTVSWSRTLSFEHGYLPGPHTTIIICNNTVNQESAFHVIEIVIGNVAIEELTVEIPSYVLIGMYFDVNVKVEQGTNVLYRVKVKDNVKFKAKWLKSKGLNTTQSIPIKLDDPGATSVIVTCSNGMSFEQKLAKTTVIRPVAGFMLTTRRSVVSYSEATTFTLHIPGEEYFPMGHLRLEVLDKGVTIRDRVELEDPTPGTTRDILSLNLTLGDHNITARLSSPLKEQDTFVTALSILPISDFNASEVDYGVDAVHPMNSSSAATNVSFTLITPVASDWETPPEGIDVTWDFGDGTPIEQEFLSSWDKIHTYTERGNYTVKVSTRLTGSEEIHNRSISVRVGVLITQVWPTEGIVNTTVFTIFLSGVWGDNLNFMIYFGDGREKILSNVSIASENNITEIQTSYRQAGVYAIRIEFWSDSFVEDLTLEIPFSVYWPVVNFDLVSPVGVRGKLPMQLSIDVTFTEPLPTNASCLLFYGDGANDTLEITRPELITTTVTTDTTTTPLVTGDSSGNETTVASDATTSDTKGTTATNQTEDSMSTDSTTTTTELTATSRPIQVSFTLMHNYTSFSQFTIRVECSNRVSNRSVERHISITADGNKPKMYWILMVISLVFAHL